VRRHLTGHDVAHAFAFASEGDEEQREWRMRLAGDLIRQERDRLILAAENLTRTSAIAPVTADIAKRFAAAARRLIPERAFATEQLRDAARFLRRARSYSRSEGGNGTAIAWHALKDAAEAWEARKHTERCMRAYGWLE
jgi:hypothetical protein